MLGFGAAVPMAPVEASSRKHYVGGLLFLRLVDNNTVLCISLSLHRSLLGLSLRVSKKEIFIVRNDCWLPEGDACWFPTLQASSDLHN